MLFFGETDMRGGMWWGEREAARCSRGESTLQLYEFSSPQHQKHIHTQPFISLLSVSFGLETCVMGWWRFYTLFRPEQEHKGKLERNTLHLQVIKSLFFLQRFMGVCKNNICTYVTYSHHIRISQLTMYNSLWSIQEFTETVYLNSSVFLVHMHKYETTVPACSLVASHCPSPHPP